MPIYVYGCKACGVVEEHLQRLSDPPLTKCPHCGGRLKKQVTSAAFQLKGGGWYKDGYASAKADKGGGADSGGSGGSSGGSDAGGSKSTGSSESAGSSGGKGSSEGKGSSGAKGSSGGKGGSEGKGPSSGGGTAAAE